MQARLRAPEAADHRSPHLCPGSEECLLGCSQFAAVVTGREQVALGIQGHRDGAVTEPRLYELGG